MKGVTVVVDLDGSDKGPEEIAAGVVLALCGDVGFGVIAVGRPDVVEWLKRRCPPVVGVSIEETATGRKSSIAVATEMVAAGEAGAVVTFGNTRDAVMRSALPLDRGGLGLVEGVTRPPLALVLPTPDGRDVVFLDAGAHVDCPPDLLVEFARLGRAFAQVAIGIRGPRIALLSNGEEKGKGNRASKGAYDLLEGEGWFVGNVQASDLLAGAVDVVVTCGFPGNIGFKALEAGAMTVMALLRQGAKRGVRGMLGAWLLRPVFEEIRAALSPSALGAMPMLGHRKGVMMIGHGASDRHAVAAGIAAAAHYVWVKLPERMAQAMQQGEGVARRSAMLSGPYSAGP